MRNHNYFVYMMTNEWKTVLYIGVTNSLHICVWQHKHGVIPGFTKRYNCNRIVYFEWFDHIDQAITREKQLKGWSRARKDALVDGMNPSWSDLAEEWYVEQLHVFGSSAGDPSPSSAPHTHTPTPGAPATQDDRTVVHGDTPSAHSETEHVCHPEQHPVCHPEQHPVCHPERAVGGREGSPARRPFTESPER